MFMLYAQMDIEAKIYCHLKLVHIRKGPNSNKLIFLIFEPMKFVHFVICVNKMHSIKQAARGLESF